MNLDDQQQKKMSAWIAEGLNLSDIQKRIETEFGLHPTYLDMRLLMNDLKLSPKDDESKATVVASKTIETNASATPAAPAEAPAGKRVSVAVDQVTRPGAVASGKVNFTDGQTAEWHLDQMGRLGFVPRQEGYRPPEADLVAFQTELQAQLQKLGF